MASKTKLTKDKYLTDLECLELERIIDKFYESDYRNCLIIELAYRTGCRAKEILNIKKSDLNEDEHSIYIHTLKGGNDREIPLPKKLWLRLIRYSNESQGEKLFDISYDMLWVIWQSYRPCEKKFHALRHTAAIRFYRKSKSIHTVKTILGHSSINSTMIYLDFVENLKTI